MTSHIRYIRRALRTTALGTFAALFVAPMPGLAFNPNEGAETSVAPTRPASRLPSTAPLIDAMPKLTFPPLPVVRQAPLENQASAVNAPAGAYVQPIPPLVEPAGVSAPSFPSVDAAVAARAAQELEASAATTAPLPAQAPVQQQGFIAPAPLLATDTTGTQRPSENPAVAAAPMPTGALPAAAAEAPVAMPQEPQLTDGSRDILSKFPSKLNSASASANKGKGKSLAINRMSPEIKAIVSPNPKVESYDSVGLSIKVQRPGLDTNFELNRAYTALSNGDTALATETYKNILSTEPNNEDALFGLATTYHRLGDLDRARPYYAHLLKVNPNHREGLNNFLALVSAEAPQEALAELERLEQRNPDFSPIPAQQAALLSKNGYADQAREKMLRAIDLAPDNLTYKYNLAVMLDKQGNYTDASALYRLLIDASLKGQKIPAPLETIQKRLNFITAAETNKNSVGG